MAYLQIKENGAASRIEVTERAILGRLPECEIQLTDPHASRRHAVVYRHGKEWFVRDLDTRNGTLVNGDKILDQALHAGDNIVIGNAMLTFFEEEPPDEPEPPDVEAPDTEAIGGYKIIEQIAHGSHARVCRVGKEGISREMAMKIIDRQAYAGGTDELFAAARALAAVSHPGIAPIYEVNPVGDPPYFVTDLMTTESLAELIAARGRLPHEHAKRIVIRVAEALEAAHAKGIVHGNLKPRNIFVGPDDTVRIIDFRCICRVESDGALAAFAGIPFYVAPEQFRKESIDPRTDVYSLGAIFYSMVGGVPPFTGGTDEQIMHKHLSDEPEDLKRLVPDLPLDLCQTIGRMLEKEPGARFRNMQEVLDALGDAQPQPAQATEQPPAQEKPLPQELPKKRIPRERQGNPALAFIAGIVLIFMLVAMFLGARDIGQAVKKFLSSTPESFLQDE
ncbi:MAG: protein kinase [Planctomycetes bacterium]|nr:protein kinase [Planctomycetota bacterium]